MRAFIFINKSLPINLGHVGWGFEVLPNEFCFGAKETASKVVVTKGKFNGVFVAYGTENDMLQTMKKGQRFTYQFYKIIEIMHTDPASAEAMAEDSKNWGYGLFDNNCMNDVFKIITCYACGDNNILPSPSSYWIPNIFFNAIDAAIQRL